jgi:predicted lipoprotein with Yx(FWY)xxD motif
MKFGIYGAAAFAALISGAVSAQSILENNDAVKEQLTLKTGRVTALGTYLTNGGGRAVYMFTADKDGKSACGEICLKAWAPVATLDKPQAGDGVQQGKIGTITTAGEEQVTYAGHPLYYFIEDAAAEGATTGQAIHSFGGEWYLLTPDGKPITAKRPGEFPNPAALEAPKP